MGDRMEALDYLLDPNPTDSVRYWSRYAVYRRTGSGYAHDRIVFGGGLLVERINGVLCFEYPGGPVVTVAHNMMDDLDERGIPYVVLPRAVRDVQGVRATRILHTSRSLGQRGTPVTLFEAERHSTAIEIAIGRGRGTPRPTLMLSGADLNEQHRNFYVCELPPSALGNVSTIAAAYEALKPRVVREAERLRPRRTILRQGDIFAVPMPSVKVSGFQRNEMILGTNHRGEEVCVGEGELTFARGRLFHRPEGRDPDHATINLGSTWHLMVKNTVPLGEPPPKPAPTAQTINDGSITVNYTETGGVAVYSYSNATLIGSSWTP